MTINGKGLEEVTRLKIVNSSETFEKPFQIISKNGSQIVSEAIDAISIPMDMALQLVLSNAYGQSSFPITFTLQNNSVTTATCSD